MIDFVSIHFGSDPQMIPMGGVDNVFVPQPGVVPLQHSDNIARLNLANLVLDRQGRLGLERNRFEVGADCSLLELVKILPAKSEERLGLLQSYPALNGTP